MRYSLARIVCVHDEMMAGNDDGGGDDAVFGSVAVLCMLLFVDVVAHAYYNLIVYVFYWCEWCGGLCTTSNRSVR